MTEVTLQKGVYHILMGKKITNWAQIPIVHSSGCMFVKRSISFKLVKEITKISRILDKAYAKES